MNNRLFIVAAPSGAGKNTLIDRALVDFPQVVDIITYTTRQPREGETNGKQYFFVSDEKFQELLDQDFFAEWAKVHDHRSGTPRDQLEQAWKEGKFPIMDLDIQGAASLKSQYPGAIGIFVLPPDMDTLRQRIIARSGGVEPDDLAIRLKNAKIEMEEAKDFDYRVINEDLETCYMEFKKIIEKLVN